MSTLCITLVIFAILSTTHSLYYNVQFGNNRKSTIFNQIFLKTRLSMTKGYEKVPTIVIGAGISGLSCAKSLSLSEATSSFLVIDRNENVGGRVQTDEFQGYLLDKGFQIFIDSYPQVVENKYGLFDYNKLVLNKFNPGAIIRYRNEFYKVADPLRQPDQIPDILFTPIGSIFDKVLVGVYSILIKFKSFNDIKVTNNNNNNNNNDKEDKKLLPSTAISTEEKNTLDFLKEDLKLSDEMINLFFKPFYQGIFLAPLELQSSNMFQFIFKVLSQGYATLPAQKGMQAIPDQMVESIISTVNKQLGKFKYEKSSYEDNTCFLLNTTVTKIEVDVSELLTSLTKDLTKNYANTVTVDEENIFAINNYTMGNTVCNPTYIVHTVQRVYDNATEKLIQIPRKYETNHIVIATDSPSAQALINSMALASSASSSSSQSTDTSSAEAAVTVTTSTNSNNKNKNIQEINNKKKKGGIFSRLLSAVLRATSTTNDDKNDKNNKRISSSTSGNEGNKLSISSTTTINSVTSTSTLKANLNKEFITSETYVISNRSSTCVYYGFQGSPPVLGPTLILNGENDLSKIIIKKTKNNSPIGKSVKTSVNAPTVGMGYGLGVSVENEIDESFTEAESKREIGVEESAVSEWDYPIDINNVCFPSEVSSSYAPKGMSLASVTIVGVNKKYSESELDLSVRRQLSDWWGEEVIKQWKLLKTYRIPFAQPSQNPPYAFGSNEVSLRMSVSVTSGDSKLTNGTSIQQQSKSFPLSGLYMCGDHIGTATLNGAIESGLKVGDLIRANS